MQYVLTLIVAASGPALDPSTIERAESILSARNAKVGEADWLAPNLACDLPFDGPFDARLSADLRGDLTPSRIDAVIQPASNRRKHLLLADMDSTVVTSETLDELADHAGLKDRIAEITQRAMQGEIAFRDALRERVAMLKGLPETALEETLTKVELSPGAQTLVRTMRAHGAYTALVSGGFTFFSSRIAERVGFDTHLGNELDIVAGALTGKVKEPILGRDGKLEALSALAQERGIPLSQTLTVGDGANDLPMLRAAGLGVAYRAKPVAAEGAAARIDHAGLDALLYIQGYRGEEFVS